MKNILLFIALIGLLCFANCGSSDEPAPDDPPVDLKQQMIDGLSKTWQVNSVTLDGIDVSDDWIGFTLKFDKSKNYIAKKLSEKSILVWPENGSYTIPNSSNPKNILRNDGIQIVLSNVTASSVKLSFTISGRSGGRVESLIGDYIFDMKN